MVFWLVARLNDANRVQSVAVKQL